MKDERRNSISMVEMKKGATGGRVSVPRLKSLSPFSCFAIVFMVLSSQLFVSPKTYSFASL